LRKIYVFRAYMCNVCLYFISIIYNCSWFIYIGIVWIRLDIRVYIYIYNYLFVFYNTFIGNCVTPLPPKLWTVSRFSFLFIYLFILLCFSVYSLVKRLISCHWNLFVAISVRTYYWSQVPYIAPLFEYFSLFFWHVMCA